MLPIRGQLHAAGHHPDNGVAFAVQAQGAPDHARIAAEAPLPKRFTQNGDVGPGLVFLGKKGATENGPHA